MRLYHFLKKVFLKRLLRFQESYFIFRTEISTRRYMKALMGRKNLPYLSNDEKKEAKTFFKSKGYYLKNTYWHRYYSGLSGQFHKNYIPYDIFKPRIDAKLNQRKLWPALQDKNLSYKLFWEFNQPKCIVQNINGFYFVDDKHVGFKEAINACNSIKEKLIIKPTVHTGGGKMVNAFKVNNSITTYKNYSVAELFAFYKKDFIVQNFLEQSTHLRKLNPSSLNTLRIVSYLNNKGVHILSSVLRIGKAGSSTDNFSKGGFFCGIDNDGTLSGKGYSPKDEVVTETNTGIPLSKFHVPNYEKVKAMVQSMHHVVPYFRIISWDIGINKDDMPYLIEHNSIGQGVDLQIASGPLFGEFTDEILREALA